MERLCPTCQVIPKVIPCPDPVKIISCPAVKPKPQLMDRVQFAWDSDVLTADGKAVLKRVKKVLEENKNYDVSIEGHASSEGQFEHNKNLSERRAKVVLEYLVSEGISRDRLLAKWFSSTTPTETNDTLKGRIANRRVIFKLEINSEREGV